MVLGKSRAKSTLFLSVVWWVGLCGGSWVVLFGQEMMRVIGCRHIFRESNKTADTRANWLMDNGDSGPGAQWMAPDLHDKMQKSPHIVLSFDGARRGSGLGAAAWILWLRDEYGSFEKFSYGGRVLRNASAMTAEREALRLGIEHLTVLFPTEVSSFDFQVECTDRTVQYKLNAQSLRLFGLHRDVNDAHRAGANRLQKKKNNGSSWARLQEHLLQGAQVVVRYHAKIDIVT